MKVTCLVIVSSSFHPVQGVTPDHAVACTHNCPMLTRKHAIPCLLKFLVCLLMFCHVFSHALVAPAYAWAISPKDFARGVCKCENIFDHQERFEACHALTTRMHHRWITTCSNCLSFSSRFRGVCARHSGGLQSISTPCHPSRTGVPQGII